MTMRKKIVFHRILFLIATVVSAMGGGRCHAACDPMLTQYYVTPSLYNPAAAGSGDAIRLMLVGRLQDVGMDGNPKIFSAVADMPLRIAGKTLGVGLNASRISEGPFRSVSANLQAGYRFTIGSGSLTAAINLGYGHERYSGDVSTDNAEHQDVLLRRKLKGNLVDLGAGLFYLRPRFWTGISLMHANAPEVTLGELTADLATGTTDGSPEEIKARYRRTGYFMAGGNIRLGSTLLEMMPSVMVKSDFDRVRGELTAGLRYKQLLTFGVGYRVKEAVTATLAVDCNGFFIGYSYDCPVGPLSRQSNGSHELIAGYSFKLDLAPKKKTKYKSIRIM